MHVSKWSAPVLLLVLILLIYSNTFNAAWQMDDHPNITDNHRLHITELNHDNILTSLFANPRASKFGELYRPVACLSFGLNWYFGKDHVFGYHLVNIMVHFIVALLLYLTIRALFDSPRLKGRYVGRRHVIALLTAVIWAAHPIQTQAVTYIVQRMASLAALFYVLGIYLFLKGRLSGNLKRQYIYYLACLVSWLAACLSKENAFLLPLSLLLV